MTLPDEEKDTWRAWCEWDKKRYDHEVAMFETVRGGEENKAGTKKRLISSDGSSVPKKKKKT